MLALVSLAASLSNVILVCVGASPLIETPRILGRDPLNAFTANTPFLVSRGQAPSTAPSGNYAPSLHQQCPATLVRQPSSQNTTDGSVLSSDERAWVSARRSNVVNDWASYLNNPAINLGGFNVTAFLANTSNLPNVGLAASGGGYRAMLHAASVFNALDARNSSSVAQGTGGILQLATYMAGLSGGSWFVGSMAINDFPTVFELRNIWNLSENLVRLQKKIRLVLKIDTDTSLSQFHF